MMESNSVMKGLARELFIFFPERYMWVNFHDGKKCGGKVTVSIKLKHNKWNLKYYCGFAIDKHKCSN